MNFIKRPHDKRKNMIDESTNEKRLGKFGFDKAKGLKNCYSKIKEIKENTPKSCHCTATNLPSRKLSKLDVPDMQDTAGEVGKNS